MVEEGGEDEEEKDDGGDDDFCRRDKVALNPPKPAPITAIFNGEDCCCMLLVNCGNLCLSSH